MSSPFHRDFPPDEIEPIDDTEFLHRIPGRDFANGEITHKFWADMNRQERRAVEASKRRVSRGRWS